MTTDQKEPDGATGTRPPGASRRHHVVPDFLLARFADSEGWLRRLDKRTGRPDRIKSRNAAYINHFYRAATIDGTTGTPVEEALAAVESEAAPALATLDSNPRAMDEDQREILGAFLHLQHTRTPLWRGWAMDHMEGVYARLLKVSASHPESFRETIREAPDYEGETDEEIEKARQLIEGGRFRVNVDPTEAMSLMLTLMADMGPMIASMSWTLLRAPESRRFITSDTPLVMTDPNPRVSFGGNGWASSPDAQSTLAISHGTMLLIEPGPRTLREVDVDERAVDRSNLRTYGWADQWIYGPTQAAVQGVRTDARRRPDLVPAPRAPTLTHLEDADPAEARPPRGAGPGAPAGFWVRGEDGTLTFNMYEVQRATGERRRRGSPGG